MADISSLSDDVSLLRGLKFVQYGGVRLEFVPGGRV